MGEKTNFQAFQNMLHMSCATEILIYCPLMDCNQRKEKKNPKSKWDLTIFLLREALSEQRKRGKQHQNNNFGTFEVEDYQSIGLESFCKRT